MADAADAAALAIGSWPGLTQDELKTKAQQFFDANYPPMPLGTVGKLNVTFLGDEHHRHGVRPVPTTFMKLANIDHIDVGATTTITKKERNIELVLVLDTTGSMGSGRQAHRDEERREADGGDAVRRQGDLRHSEDRRRAVLRRR